MGAFEILVRQEAEKVVKDSACVFSAPARVISVEGNQKYKVQLVTSDAQYILANYSGSDLYVGESIQIYYRNNYISEQTAYIGSSLTKASGHVGGLQFIKLTQTEYDAIVNKDNNTVYYVVNNGIVIQYLGSTPVGSGYAVNFGVDNGELDIVSTASSPSFTVNDGELIVSD